MTCRLLSRTEAALAAAVSVVAVSLSVPPLRGLIEQSMVWHIVVQMPMLVAGGWLSMRILSGKLILRTLDVWNRYGLTGFVGAQAIAAYWMLPVAIDRAVVLPQSDVLKVLTLFACGAMLGHSFERAPAVIQLFFVGYSVSMLAWLGIYISTTDLRLCNAYSLESRTAAGRAIAMLGITLGCIWLVEPFAGPTYLAEASRLPQSGPRPPGARAKQCPLEAPSAL